MVMELTDMKEFLIIDDDPINNFICKKMLLEISSEAGIKTFERALLAMDYLVEASKNSSGYPTHIILDLNMPEFNGWQFLQEYENNHLHLKSSAQLFVVSSTILKEEIDRINKIPFVAGFISKPLNLQKIRKLVEMEGMP